MTRWEFPGMESDLKQRNVFKYMLPDTQTEYETERENDNESKK